MLFEDFGNLAWVNLVLAEAKKIVSFVIGKSKILTLYINFSEELFEACVDWVCIYVYILTNMLYESVQWPASNGCES